MPDRLLLNEDRLFPVQAFFNAVSDVNFVDVVGRLLRGVGHSSDYAHCQFVGDLEPDDEPFDGVRFSLFEDAVVIPIEEFVSYLRGACDSYVARYPEARDQLNRLLSSS